MDEGSTAVGVESSDPLIAQLMQFCDQQHVQQRHKEFCRTHVDEFHGFSADEDDEKSHRVHELFNEYERMFEDTFQEFLSVADMSGDEFYGHCRRLQRASRDHTDALTNLRIILSALDFDAFCKLMEREAIETQRALKEAEDMGF